MPIYEYHCENCDHVTSYYQKEMDGGPDEDLCEVCGTLAKKRPSWVSHSKKGKGPA